MSPSPNGEDTYWEVEVQVDVAVPRGKVDVDPKGQGKLGQEVNPTKLDGPHTDTLTSTTVRLNRRRGRMNTTGPPSTFGGSIPTSGYIPAG